MSQRSGAYTELVERVRDINRLKLVEALLDWDQETCMPPDGVEARADQIALISGVVHERITSNEIGALLEAAEKDGVDPDDYVRVTNLRETQRLYERATKIPNRLVKDIAHTATRAKSAWARARAENDFGIFAPLLTRMVELKREVATHVGYEAEPYDALMDEFEPGATAAEVEAVFKELRGATVELLQRLQAAPNPPDSSILTRHYPRSAQEEFSGRLARALNFNFDAGRMDVSTHPFTTTIGGSADVRFTTRYQEDFLPSAIFGTLHEVGHALYEQGLPREHIFTPMGEHISLGIHESQSRMWENLVGRSRPFWEYHYPALRKLFATALSDVSLDGFYAAINTVSPSFIRVEADELTYNLHIVLRFELERAIISGKLAVADVPQAWNAKMQEVLGVTPPDDAQGCLQDVHWSMGIFGYFPTYALGNLYAAQFFAQARRDLPDLHDQIRANNHVPLLDWLRKNIHQQGQRYRAGELVEKVTGTPLTLKPFMTYVTDKSCEVYGV